jgi:hypothetical protein
MATIDSDLYREVYRTVVNDSFIKSKLGKDERGTLSVRPTYIPTGMVFPAITIEIEEAESEIMIPATRAHLTFTIWCDEKKTNEPYKFLKQIGDHIVALFNREGSKYNNVDVGTNTGVRICLFRKMRTAYGFDDFVKYFFYEVIFDVTFSESESFASEDAGDLPWE